MLSICINLTAKAVPILKTHYRLMWLYMPPTSPMEKSRFPPFNSPEHLPVAAAEPCEAALGGEAVAKACAVAYLVHHAERLVLKRSLIRTRQLLQDLSVQCDRLLQHPLHKR